MSGNRKRAIEIIVEQLDRNKEEITEDAHFQDDLGADSLDMTEMIMVFEEEFGIEIPDEDAKELPTVGDVLRKLEELSI